MEVLTQVLIFAGLIALALLSFKIKFKSEREYDKYLEDSLEDEYIIDPATGRKMTLEQAESGNWVDHDNEFQIVPEEVIDTYFVEEQKEVERTLNYIKESKEYLIKKDNEIIAILEASQLFKHYKDWYYTDIYELTFVNGFAIISGVTYDGSTYYDVDNEETHILFLLNLDFDTGNYLLRPKNAAEKFLDLIENDDDLHLSNY